MPAVDTTIARCLDCGYKLHGLPTGRCPECGRHFDWDNPSSVDPTPITSRWARLALKPLGPGNWRLTCAAAAAMFWGWGALPGGFLVFTAALLLLLVLQLYGLVRLLTREIALAVYRPPRRQYPLNTNQRYRTAILLLILAFSFFFDLPLYLSGNLTRLLAGRTVQRMYTVDPMPSAPLGPRLIGPLLARQVAVWPNGVSIHTFAGRELRYQPYSSHQPGIEIGGSWYWVGPPSRELSTPNFINVMKIIWSQPRSTFRYLIYIFREILQELLSSA